MIGSGKVIPGPGPAGRAQGWRRACRGLVFAAGVTLRQMGMVPMSRRHEPPPFVLLVDEPRGRFSERERVGNMVLTQPLSLRDTAERSAGDRN